MRLAQQGLDLLGEIGLVDLVDLGRDLQLHSGRRGDPDRRIGRLFRRDPAEEGKIAAGPEARQQQPLGQAVMDGRDVVRLRQRLALGIRDRDHGGIIEETKQRLQLRQIEPSVQGRHIGQVETAEQAEAHIVDMQMNDVEIVAAAGQLLQHEDMRGQVIPHALVQAKRLGPGGMEPCLGRAVAAGEQRHFMAKSHHFVAEIGDDALGAAIKLGRNRLHQRGNLGDLHRTPCPRAQHAPLSDDQASAQICANCCLNAGPVPGVAGSLA